MKRLPSTRVRRAQLLAGQVLSVEDRALLRQLAVDRLCGGTLDTPYLHAPGRQSLRDAPGWPQHGKAIESLAEVLVDAVVHEDITRRELEHTLTSSELRQLEAVREQAHKGLQDYLSAHWTALWQGGAPPFDVSDVGMYLEEKATWVVHDLLFPPYRIPPKVALSMYDRALSSALQALEAEGVPFKDGALMQDDVLVEAIEQALRTLCDERLRSSQTHTVRMVDPDVTRGTPSHGNSFADTRDWHHQIRNAVMSVKRIQMEEAPPPDMYDMFAELEARLGTAQAGALGRQLYERFTGSIDRSVRLFEKRHHLREPFYYKGAEPSF